MLANIIVSVSAARSGTSVRPFVEPIRASYVMPADNRRELWPDTSACGLGRDCNAPSPFADFTLTGDSSLATVMASSGASEMMVHATQEGVDIARHFLGTATSLGIFVFEPNGPK